MRVTAGVYNLYETGKAAIDEYYRVQKVYDVHREAGQTQTQAVINTGLVAISDATGGTQIMEAVYGVDTNRMLNTRSLEPTLTGMERFEKASIGVSKVAGTALGIATIEEAIYRRPTVALGGENNSYEPKVSTNVQNRFTLEEGWVSQEQRTIWQINDQTPVVIAEGNRLPFKSNSVDVTWQSVPIGDRSNMLGPYYSPGEIRRIQAPHAYPLYPCPNGSRRELK